MNKADLQQWLDAYGRAWETLDSEAVAALFTADARYFEKPFDEPAVGHQGIRKYWVQDVGNHRQVRFSYDILTIDGNFGYVAWKTRFNIVPSNVAAYLDGIFVLEFDDSGLCRELREWWFYEVAQ